MKTISNQEQRRNRALNIPKWVAATAQRASVMALLAATEVALAGGGGGGGGPIQGVVNGVNIVLATVTAVCLALATIAIGMFAYKTMFDGATFRDTSKLLLGAALAGSAGGIAAMFMTN